MFFLGSWHNFTKLCNISCSWCPGWMWNLLLQFCICIRVCSVSITCEYVWGRVVVRVLHLGPSITIRYQIHANRCSVLNDKGPWQPSTDEREAPDQVHKHIDLHTFKHFTRALCCSYHPHHLQLRGKWELHAMMLIWWKFTGVFSVLEEMQLKFWRCCSLIGWKAFIWAFLKHCFSSTSWSIRSIERESCRQSWIREVSHLFPPCRLPRQAEIVSCLRWKKRKIFGFTFLPDSNRN